MKKLVLFTLLCGMTSFSAQKAFAEISCGIYKSATAKNTDNFTTNAVGACYLGNVAIQGLSYGQNEVSYGVLNNCVINAGTGNVTFNLRSDLSAIDVNYKGDAVGTIPQWRTGGEYAFMNSDLNLSDGLVVKCASEGGGNPKLQFATPGISPGPDKL